MADVPKVGRRCEVKEVARGFAMNFLLPKKLAKIADPGALRQLEKLRADDEIKRGKEIREGRILLAKLDGLTIVLQTKTNEQGHLFAAVHKKDIVQLLSQKYHLSLGENNLSLAEPLKLVGQYKIPVVIGEGKGELDLSIESV